MHKGTEIDFVLNDSLKALKLYQTIFDEIELIEATDYPRGNNEVIFSLYGTRFHMLDENPPLGLTALLLNIQIRSGSISSSLTLRTHIIKHYEMAV